MKTAVNLTPKIEWHLLQRLEGHFIRAYGDRSQDVQIYVLAEGREAAKAFLDNTLRYGTCCQHYIGLLRKTQVQLRAANRRSRLYMSGTVIKRFSFQGYYFQSLAAFGRAEYFFEGRFFIPMKKKFVLETMLQVLLCFFFIFNCTLFVFGNNTV